VAEDSDIKNVSYAFVPIAQLAETEANSNVDLLAVVKAAGEVSEINTKKGTVMKKRELTIVDASGADVRLTLWGGKAEENTPWHEQPIIACKGLRVGEYNNGKTVSTSMSCTLSINPVDLPAAYELHQVSRTSPHHPYHSMTRTFRFCDNNKLNLIRFSPHFPPSLQWRVEMMESKGSLASSSVSALGMTGSGGDRAAEPLDKRADLSVIKSLQVRKYDEEEERD